jgi:hypothetical protein
MLQGLAIALLGFLFQIGLQQGMRSHALQGMYYQQWSSDYLMQTVSMEDLRDAPLETLSHIHIQPPALDAVRAILAAVQDSPDPHTLVRNVDRALYVLWALLYGLLGAIVFLWLSQMTGAWYAAVAALVFLAHPASIFYATLLDGTLLSAVLILWAYYLVWTIRMTPEKQVGALCAAVLALFFTRSIFQWPAVLVFALSLILLKAPKRNIIVFLIVCGGLAGLYTGKQYYQFGIASTSSFTGLNLENSIGRSSMHDYWTYLDRIAISETQGNSLPAVLVRKKKLEGTPNFNHAAYLTLNKRLIQAYKEDLAAMPPVQLVLSYLQNTRIYFTPSSRYSNHVIVDRIPWRNFYDRIFSFPILPGLIVLAAIVWFLRAQRSDYLAGTALAFPGLFIFLISVLFEKGENMRFKFFLEPVVFVLIASQLFVAVEHVYRKVRSRRSS